MFAENIAESLFVERKCRKLILVENRTDVPFIAGDQPAINLKSGGFTRPPNNLSIYYPIGPSFALLLSDVDEEPMFPSDGLTAEQVVSLNKMLAEACYQQVFAQAEGSLLKMPVAS